MLPEQELGNNIVVLSEIGRCWEARKLAISLAGDPLDNCRALTKQRFITCKFSYREKLLTTIGGRSAGIL